MWSYVTFVVKLTDGSNKQTGDEHVSSEQERDFSILKRKCEENLVD
jgi:hypothetical protein